MGLFVCMCASCSCVLLVVVNQAYGKMLIIVCIFYLNRNLCLEDRAYCMPCPIKFKIMLDCMLVFAVYAVERSRIMIVLSRYKIQFFKYILKCKVSSDEYEF